MVEKIDLLVHIGASSTRRDDENYRAQAKAYLDFQGDVVQYARPNGVEDTDVDHSDIDRNETTVFLDDTQLAYNALDSQLITSSMIIPSQVTIRSGSQLSRGFQDVTGHRNISAPLEASARRPMDVASNGKRKLNSPSLERDDPANDEANEAELRLSSSDAMSTPRAAPYTHPLSQSSYLKSPILDRSRLNKKRRLNSDGRSFDSSPASKQAKRPHYIALPEQNGPSIAYIGDVPVISTEPQVHNENAEANGEGPRSYETTSELPTSYSLSDITSESSRARNRVGVSQRSASDPGPKFERSKEGLAKSHAAAENVANQIDEVGRQQPMLADAATNDIASTSAMLEKQNVQEVEVPRNVELVNETAIRDQEGGNRSAPSASNPTIVTGERSTSPPHTLPALSKTIRPPSPPPAQDNYTSHITSTLHWLASSASPVHKSYHPLSITRDIRPLERGYWLLDYSSWTRIVQVEFWQYLERCVGCGKCGWGVWCCREDGVDGEQGSNGVSGGNEDGGSRLKMVKVFCWGEIVQHVYLLLYVASKSQVRKLGCVWVDAEGEVVVRMRKG